MSDRDKRRAFVSGFTGSAGEFDTREFRPCCIAHELARSFVSAEGFSKFKFKVGLMSVSVAC